MQLTRGKIGFRIIEDADRAFLFDLFASTREWEFQQTSWTSSDWQDFLQGQFAAQDLHYQQAFPNAIRRIVQIDGEDIGRLYVDRQDDCLRIIEFSLTPSARGRGIGTDILRSLMNEAHGGKVPVRLHVEKGSPALNLYLRHGFRAVSDEGHHVAMEWMPNTAPREI